MMKAVPFNRIGVHYFNFSICRRTSLAG